MFQLKKGNGERHTGFGRDINYRFPYPVPRTPNPKDPKDIAAKFSLQIIYEKPIKNEYFMRISEYRKKTKQIVIFYPEFENEAIAHELFHHIENICNFKFNRAQSEKMSRIFASQFNT